MLAFFVRFFVAYRSHCCRFFRPHPFFTLLLADNNANGDDFSASWWSFHLITRRRRDCHFAWNISFWLLFVVVVDSEELGIKGFMCKNFSYSLGLERDGVSGSICSLQSDEGLMGGWMDVMCRLNAEEAGGESMFSFGSKAGILC
jgi:hypothetical protein